MTSEFPALDDMVARIRRWSHSYAGALFQIAVAERSNEWRLCCGKLTFLQNHLDSTAHTYPHFQYLAEWLSVDEAVERIQAIIGKPGKVMVGDIQVPVEGQFQMYPNALSDGLRNRMVCYAERPLPLLNGWPYYLYCFNLHNPNKVPHDDLRADAQPYYPRGLISLAI